ncbi:GDSL-type esterase/lipase family protein [Aetokthonos hydrillicola Thurmond2011]|uniref:GDSL-type esterase/lipase family protein n=1 Tax=Aetokthonos hydrillicola Thurmond2011 TaxID=2712845 RepID=A0AAP5MEH0_9CYAN|nr:GDSL-type esterase/lipase family protein [Aetokthonos hydrillicola]MDR9900964.1 GDSL-type esterase/lipase family protein [Aetokthonos hydrillicola Thurmond2011]
MNPNLEKQSRPVRLMFAGGCHVLGYPVGERNGFPAEIKRLFLSANAKAVYHCVGYLKLTHFNRLNFEIQQFQPDVLILQIGHYELTKKMLDVGLSSRSRKSTTIAPHPPRFATTKERLAWRVRSLLKLVIHLTFSRFRVDHLAFKAELEQFLGSIEMAGPRVVILSPFPAADPVVTKIRMDVLEVFRSSASAHNMFFVDIAKTESFVKAGFAPYYDGIHLNAEGHRRIAKALMPPLLSIVSNVEIPSIQTP